MTPDTSIEIQNGLITIVIVNYETSAFVKRCIQSLEEQSYPWEAVIVDNPSAAMDYRNLPAGANVRIVRSPENVGYGLGCNLGASMASPESEYICILNPDTAVAAGELERWVRSYERNCRRGGIVGPALHNDNGAVQKSSYDFYTPVNYWFTHSLVAGFLINMKKGSWTGGKGRGFAEAGAVGELSGEMADERARMTGWLMGAALLMNRESWNRLLGFSDHYFLYSEDTDLCWRCHQAGLPVVYDPGVHIWHSQGDPAAGAARETGIVRLFDGMKRFVDLNYTGIKRTGMYFVVCLDMIIRLVLMTPLKLIRQNDVLLESRLRGYSRVLKQWLGW